MNSTIERLRKEKAELEAAEIAKAEIKKAAWEKRKAEIKMFAVEDVEGFLKTAPYEDILKLERKIPNFTTNDPKMAFLYKGNIKLILDDMPGNGYLLNRYSSHGLSLEDRDEFNCWINALRDSFQVKWEEIKKSL